MVVAESQVSEYVIKARALEVKAKETEVVVHDARLLIKELKDKCSRSKQQLLEREEEIKGLKVRLEELTDELRTAQQNPIVTSEVSKRIIEDFKSSEDFLREVVEGSTDGFTKGFELCHSQIRSLFPDFDLSQLKEFSDDEEDDAENIAEVEAGELVGTSERVSESGVDIKVGGEEVPATPEDIVDVEATEDLPLIVERQDADEAEKEE